MFNFKNKDMEFFDLFLESARFFHKGAVLMNEVMMDYSKADAKMDEIVDLEHEADAVNEKIIDKLNQTFITPIDREDIFSLANGLDDGVDLLQGTLQRMVMYHTTGPTRQGSVGLSKLLMECTEEILTALTLLKNVKANQQEILKSCHKIGKLESEGDLLYRREVAKLFENETNPVEIIKWKDIMEYLENTLDQCERVSDMIRGVVMKYA